MVFHNQTLESTTEPGIGQPSPAGFENMSKAEWSAGHPSVCHNLDQVSDLRVTVTCGLDRYIPPILLVIGLVSNSLVILVMRSKSFRKLSTSFYMEANASVDILSLVIPLPIHWLFVNFPDLFKPLHNHHWLCASLNFVGWGTSDLGVLYTVAMTTERALAIRLPLKAPRLCTRRRARWTVAGLTLLEVVKVGHLTVTSQVMVGEDTTSRLCDVSRDDPGYAWFHAYIWPWLHTAMLLICYLLAALGNFVIMQSIASSRKGVLITSFSGREDSYSLSSPAVSTIPSVTLSTSNRSIASLGDSDRAMSLSTFASVKDLSTSGAANPKGKDSTRIPLSYKSQRSQIQNARNLQLSIMLVTDSLTLVLCTLPFSVVELLMTRYQALPNQAGGKNLAFTATFYLLYVNRCLNFFLYCLSGARFRSALVEIFQSGENRPSVALAVCSRIPERSPISATTRKMTCLSALSNQNLGETSRHSDACDDNQDKIRGHVDAGNDKQGTICGDGDIRNQEVCENNNTGFQSADCEDSGTRKQLDICNNHNIDDQSGGCNNDSIDDQSSVCNIHNIDDQSGGCNNDNIDDQSGGCNNHNIDDQSGGCINNNIGDQSGGCNNHNIGDQSGGCNNHNIGDQSGGCNNHNIGDQSGGCNNHNIGDQSGGCNNNNIGDQNGGCNNHNIGDQSGGCNNHNIDDPSGGCNNGNFDDNNDDETDCHIDNRGDR